MSTPLVPLQPVPTPAWDRTGRRIAVIGDVAGHLDELRTELARLGADARTGRLPDDLTVIQVGDLVHRGPESDGVVQLVDHYLTDQPRQWIQLVGNHEAQYLRTPVFQWPQRIDPTSAESIRRWWASGQMRAAASIFTHAECFLITHAGVTAGFWREQLGGIRDPAYAAAAINALIGTQEDVLFRAGQMLGGRRHDRLAGPIWAAAATELVPGWLGITLPFSQIHGHTSVFDWRRRRFYAGEEIAQRTRVDEEAKHESVRLDGGRIIGVDPGHEQQPRRPWRAWEMRT
jgi:hypothetical protein